MRHVIVAFTFLVFGSLTSYSQLINVKKLDSLFDILQEYKLATGSVAVSIDGKIVYQRAIGFVKLEGDKTVAPDKNTKYRIGSVSKMFTAVLIFQLIDEGKLTLNQNLAAYFPQLPNADKITIEQMLYHRSGLHDYTRETNFPDWMDQPRTQAEMLDIITMKGADFQPGAKAEYSNTNYLLLSYIIEKIDNTPFEAALQKRIISKIRLKNTYYAKPIDADRNESASFKYSDSAWHKEKETAITIHLGAGLIVSTPADLTVFITKLFDNDLVSRRSLTRMTTIRDGYGMGLFPYNFETTKGYGHNGRIEEFYTAVRYYPSKKLAVSYITNGVLYPRTDILEGAQKILFNENYTIPFLNAEDLQNVDLEKYAGEYSSDDLPFTVICKKGNKVLIVEAAGKTMEAIPINNNYFMNAKTGSFFEFYPEKGELQIKETDNVYYLRKIR